MNRVAIAIGGAAIAGVSFAIGRATAPSAPASAVVRPESMGFAERQPAMECPDDALRECEKKLGLAEAVFRAQEHDKVGDPVPFPDGLPPQYRPEGFEDAVRRALAACPSTGLGVGRVDCSEFPCMVFFSQPRGSHNHAIDGLRECDAWREQFGVSHSGGNGVFMTDQGTVEYSYTAPAPDDFVFDDNAGKRFSLRSTEGQEQLMADVDGREMTQIELLDHAIGTLRGQEGQDEFVALLEEQRAKLVAAQNAAP